MYHLYILKSPNGKYYTGITKNLSKRMLQHRLGRGADYTKRDTFQLAYSEKHNSRSDAEEREKQIKGWSRAKKEALIRKDFSLLKQLSKNHEVDEGLIGAE